MTPLPVPRTDDFPSRLRSAAVAARVGLWLGICFGVAFVTGLISHYAQATSQPVPFPTSPAWGYQVTQGLHVIAGTAAVPLLLVKLWAVYPRLFLRLARVPRAMVVGVLERLATGILVSTAVFQLASGLANTTQWYPWAFSFRSTHYAIAWVAIGALLVHIAVKLPITRAALGAGIDDARLDRPTAVAEGPISRRTLVRAAWLAAGVAVAASATSTVPGLRRIAVLGSRTGEGPGGVPINTTAVQARIDPDTTGPSYRLVVVHGARREVLDLEALRALPQQSHTLPIACVEGWSASGTWTGVRLRTLLDLVEAPRGSDVRVSSLQSSGPFNRTILPGNFADDDRTMLVLALAGDPLTLDHGYPARLMAPNRPGVLQTKWVSHLEVLA
jgi:DMSO/TMAO reductase YedYZ molybdopterin-dependent catalytic subunit